ncbi:MAG: DUF58 domain-containing protein [Gemmataceae bacterium]
MPAQFDRLELEVGRSSRAIFRAAPCTRDGRLFAQHREHPGDDIKHTIGKAHGRTERYHLKQYEQKRIRGGLLADASESMSYGSGEQTKYDLACGAAAAMGYLVLNQTDSVGLGRPSFCALGPPITADHATSKRAVC